MKDTTMRGVVLDAAALGRRVCFLPSLVVLIVASTADATPPPPEARCLPDPGGRTIYVCDELVDGTTSADEPPGGTFVSGDGWRVNGCGERLLYELPADAESGRLSFWVRGLAVGSSFTNDNHHIFELFNEYDFGTTGVNWANMRVYGPAGPDCVGETKFSYGSDAGEGCDRYHWNRVARTWVADHWYHFEMEYDGDGAVVRIDGVEEGSVSTPGCTVALRRLFVPLKKCLTRVILPPLGAVFAYVSFVGVRAPSCTEPCSDDNPCTAGDGCVDDMCAGTPVADGTPCDDGDPTTGTSECRAGACAGTCSLPDPDGIVVSEDASASRDWPTDDITELEVEGDAEGEPVAGFYLKFRVDLPAGHRTTSARVRLYCDCPAAPRAAEGGGGSIWVVPDSSWGEDALTWSGRPAIVGEPLDSLGHIEPGNWYEFDVSAAVSAPGLYSFGVFSSDRNGGHYLSREGGAATCRPPYLVVTSAPVTTTDAGADGDADPAGDAGRDVRSGDAGGDGGVEPDMDGSMAEGCECSMQPASRGGPLALLLASCAWLALHPRRRRRPDARGNHS